MTGDHGGWKGNVWKICRKIFQGLELFLRWFSRCIGRFPVWACLQLPWVGGQAGQVGAKGIPYFVEGFAHGEGVGGDDLD